jgi:hypothetical protein
MLLLDVLVSALDLLSLLLILEVLPLTLEIVDLADQVNVLNHNAVVVLRMIWKITCS